jgi:hypothetical protein
VKIQLASAISQNRALYIQSAAFIVLTVANHHLIFVGLYQSFICEMIAHHEDGQPCTLSLRFCELRIIL